MKKGDVVLIHFPFTDLKGNKNRPAVVLLETENDVTVVSAVVGVPKSLQD